MRAVLFDLDRTLLDHDTAERAAALALRAHVGAQAQESKDAFCLRWHSVQEHHYARYVAGVLTLQEQRRARIRDVIDAHVSEHEADALFAVYLEVYERTMQLFADALPCLDALAPRALGVITNGDGVQQRAKLERAGVHARFATVIASGDWGFGKPDRRIFELACARLDVRPQQALYVGDHYFWDALGARDAGLNAVWLDRARSGSPPGDRAGVQVIHSLAELPALV